MQNRTKGIHRIKGKTKGGLVEYHYAWRGGPRFWSSNDGVTKNGADYWAAYQQAVADRNPSAGLFREVLQAYLEAPEFKALKPRSQKDIRASLFSKGGIDAKFGDAPLAAFNDPRIRKIAYQWRDGYKSSRTADARIAHLAAIVSWAVDRQHLRQHHLQKVRRLYKADRAEIIWFDDEIETFVEGAPEWVGRILVAATETGLRPGDLAKLSKAHVRNGQIRIRTGKRDRYVAIPVTRRMQALIDATPASYGKGVTRLHILAGARGAPIANPDRLGRKVGEWRDQLGLRKELHLYDARGTAATRLFEADASLRQIATHMGWSIQHAARMIEVYVANNPDVSDDLVVKLEACRA